MLLVEKNFFPGNGEQVCCMCKRYWQQLLMDWLIVVVDDSFYEQALITHEICSTDRFYSISPWLFHSVASFVIWAMDIHV